MRLCRGDTLLVGPASDRACAQLVIAEGLVRIAASFSLRLSDITLAFSGPGQPEQVRIDCNWPYLLEAVTDVEFEIVYDSMIADHEDLIATWLLRLHLVRHHLSAEHRINHLLCELAQQFGIRTARGYCLPFLLTHARLAEVVGSTRSTVTRQLNRLREAGYLEMEATARRLTLTDSFYDLFCRG